MERRVKRALHAMLACALVMFALPVLADSQARIVRLSYLDGSVQIDRNTGNGFERAIMNMPVVQGTKLATGDDGEAEIEFENGSTLRLTPDSTVDFRQLSLNSEGGKVTLVDVGRGTAYFDVKHKGEDDFRAVFDSHDVQLKKSAHFRAEVEDRQITLTVFGGELELQGTDGDVKVKKNETVSFNLDDSNKYTLAKGVENNQYDWWDKERSEYQDRYALNKDNDRPYSRYSSNYGYGWSDLNYYGNFFYVPGYGYAWRPTSVDYGWDPFSSGYWVWYPSWGYTWVSNYPWGWTPYRYGRWSYLPGYGWSWLPGYTNVWYTAPQVYNPPPSYRAPAPPKTPPSRSGVVPVGNPQPPRMVPRWRTADENRNMPGRGFRPNAGARPGTVTGGTSAGAPATVKSQPVPRNSPGSDAERMPAGRMNPDARRGTIDAPQRRMEAPRQAPRAIESPRMERPATAAPRVSPPSAPQTFSPPPSMPRSAPSAGAASHAGTPRPDPK